MKNRPAMTTATVAALMMLSGCGGEAASENNQSAMPANESMAGEGNVAGMAAAPEPAPTAEPDAPPEAESKAEPKAEPRSEPKAAPRPEAKAAPRVAPKAAPEPEPKPAEKAPATPACAPEHRALGHC